MQKKYNRKILIVISIFFIIALIGIIYRIVNFKQLRNETAQQTVLTVATVQAKHGSDTEEIILPGNVQAWHEATIYARTNGYIERWLVDIGAHVKEGDLLAKISAPEVNAQLRQTEAELKTAQANNVLAQSTAKRWLFLLKTDSVSKQETDEKVSDAQAKAAIVASTQANRDRLRDLVSYQRVVAPFDGVIISRNTDLGKLINAGSGSAPPLFRIVQWDPLRVYVRVPQNYASRITSGMTTQLSFTQHPGKTYTAKLLDTAKAIDANSRTLLVQFMIANPKYELLPGSYTEVNLIIPTPKGSVRLPVNTLIFRAEGLQVATIDKDNCAVLKPIKIGRDFGETVEVVWGVKPGETVILNPSDSLITGQKVQVVSSAAKDNKKT